MRFYIISSQTYTALACKQYMTLYISSSIQQVTFTNWVNDRLKAKSIGSSSIKVTDISTDLQDGVALIRLLENLTGKKMRGYEKTPKLTAHKMVNLDLVFQFLKKENIKTIGIGEVYEILKWQ